VAETEERIESEQECVEGFLEVAKKKEENKLLVIKAVDARNQKDRNPCNCVIQNRYNSNTDGILP